ncbi:uncharacterized protein CMU_024140 [Cryptosporidium muris RN66]|uniref:Uncharacterized protein n=1 Tax=Cryptosporidium muris (strain RN66) TaxID=441375 RepID=B6AC56_CRYMR|nr:uncharacterized protein CMU_024140 [Cryptosporidium muris RN66]EEA05409.1 hypothetical protein, conserved [Cryptosporidium muris RN66]|eukprot:XP_002139758.1 hypothetical protein [Cryptosporidium muris RN66]
MSITRRRAAEKKKTKGSTQYNKANTEVEEGTMANGLHYLQHSISELTNILPSYNMYIFWSASIIESCFFYIYLTLFRPILRPLIFEDYGHKYLMNILSNLSIFPFLQYYNFVKFINALFNWLEAWEISNQTRLLGFSASFIFGKMIYRGYEVCPTYSIINFYLGKYPSFSTMIISVISSSLGGILAGYLLYYMLNDLQILDESLLQSLRNQSFINYPIHTFFVELFLSFVYSLGVSIVCRAGSHFYGAAELSWFTNTNLVIIARTLKAPAHLTLTYSAMYGAFSGDIHGAIITGTANIFGAILLIQLLRLHNSTPKRTLKNKQSIKNKRSYN